MLTYHIMVKRNGREIGNGCFYLFIRFMYVAIAVVFMILAQKGIFIIPLCFLVCIVIFNYLFFDFDIKEYPFIIHILNYFKLYSFSNALTDSPIYFRRRIDFSIGIFSLFLHVLILSIYYCYPEAFFYLFVKDGVSFDFVYSILEKLPEKLSGFDVLERRENLSNIVELKKNVYFFMENKYKYSLYIMASTFVMCLCSSFLYEIISVSSFIRSLLDHLFNEASFKKIIMISFSLVFLPIFYIIIFFLSETTLPACYHASCSSDEGFHYIFISIGLSWSLSILSVLILESIFFLFSIFLFGSRAHRN